MIDFLVWQGHSWSEIANYTLRQLDLFVSKANERIKAMNAPSESGRGMRGKPSW